MASRRCFVKCHGRIQGYIRLTKNPRGHWCGSNPYPKAKSLLFCCKWLFLQIQGAQHATPSHCWPQETIYRCLCVDAKFFEWCIGFIFVFNYRKVIWGDMFNDNNFHEGIKLYIIKDKGYSLLPWLMMLHK
jgi:hypothetical protein